MELILIRHADALPLGERGITEDADRSLSEVGEEQARQIGTTLQKKQIAFSKLVTSPFLRARQTTELLLGALGASSVGASSIEVQISDALTPEAKPRKLAKFLKSIETERVALVGHLPHLAIWTGWLIGAKKAQIEIVKAGIVCIHCEEVAKSGGVLRWLITPEWFA